jgi:hypothetical protein
MAFRTSQHLDNKAIEKIFNKSTAKWTIISIAATIIAGVVFFYLGNMLHQKNLSKLQPTTETENDSPLSTFSQEERDAFLYAMIQDEQWQTVVNATDDGIKNYREMIWDDLHFWSARASALMQLGRCMDAGVAAYHILISDSDHELAATVLSSIQDETLCVEPSL